MEFESRRKRTTKTRCKEVVAAMGMAIGVFAIPVALVEGGSYLATHDFYFSRNVVMGVFVLGVVGALNRRMRTQESESMSQTSDLEFHLPSTLPEQFPSEKPLFIPNHRYYRDTDLRQISKN